MNDPLEEQVDGSTPLTEEEQQQLIPSYIALRHELNEAEQSNILEAEEWAFLRRRDILTGQHLDKLHKRMFGRVWHWAGEHRQSNKNIGIDAYRISTELPQLLEDCRYWIDRCLEHLGPILAPRHEWAGHFAGNKLVLKLLLTVLEPGCM